MSKALLAVSIGSGDDGSHDIRGHGIDTARRVTVPSARQVSLLLDGLS